MDHSSKVAVTMGDPAGIGPEIIIKAFWEGVPSVQAIVIGDADCLRSAAQKFAPTLTIHPVSSIESAQFEPGTLDVLDLANVSPRLPAGQPSAQGGEASVQFIRKAVDLAVDHKVDAVTTAPISKESMHLAGHPYPGHTELLAKLTGSTDSALMLAGGKLRVVLVTTHVPLEKVQPLITQERLIKILKLTHQWLSRHVKASPHIAVTGLNPHCGDGGIFGEEEKIVIIPALEQAREEGIQASGPFSADALFPSARSGEYDAVVAMYHDQGMIPVKMESMGSAVNITLGLPIIRTSVDHGTAYDITGKGIACPQSLKSAIQTAVELSKPKLAPK